MEKPSKQIEALQAELNKFDDERFNQGIPDRVQEEEVRGELEAAGL